MATSLSSDVGGNGVSYATLLLASELIGIILNKVTIYLPAKSQHYSFTLILT